MGLLVKDANNTVQTLKTDIDGSGNQIPHHIVDSSGLPNGAAADASLQEILTALATTVPGTSGNPAQVTVISSPSSGLASQTTIAALLDAVQAQATLIQNQPITASALPLPTGAATEARLVNIYNTLLNCAPPPTQVFKYVSFGSGSTTLVAAPSAGLNTVITSLQIGNSSSTPTWVNITDGTNNYSVYAGVTAQTHAVFGQAAGFNATVATAVTASCETSGCNLRITIGYYTANGRIPQ